MRKCTIFYSLVIASLTITSLHAMHLARYKSITPSLISSGRKNLPLQARAAHNSYATKRDRPVNVLYDKKAIALEASEKYPSNEDWSDLHEHAYKGNTECLEKLLHALRNRTAVDIKDRYAQTPLWWAASRGQCEVAKLLLKAGAKINEVDLWGRGPLHAAAGDAGPSMVRLLLWNGAKVDMQDCTGSTPLHEVSEPPNIIDDAYDWRTENHARNAEVIVDHCFSRLLEIQDNQGCTPVDRAVNSNHLKVLSVYLPCLPSRSIKEVTNKLSDCSLVDLLLKFQKDNGYLDKQLIGIYAPSELRYQKRQFNDIYGKFKEIPDYEERLSFLRKEISQLDKSTILHLFYTYRLSKG